MKFSIGIYVTTAPSEIDIVPLGTSTIVYIIISPSTSDPSKTIAVVSSSLISRTISDATGASLTGFTVITIICTSDNSPSDTVSLGSL